MINERETVNDGAMYIWNGESWTNNSPAEYFGQEAAWCGVREGEKAWICCTIQGNELWEQAGLSEYSRVWYRTYEEESVRPWLTRFCAEFWEDGSVASVRLGDGKGGVESINKRSVLSRGYIEGSQRNTYLMTPRWMAKGLPLTLNPTLHSLTAKDGDGDGEDVGLGLQRAAQQQGAKNRVKSKQLRRLCLMVLDGCNK